MDGTFHHFRIRINQMKNLTLNTVGCLLLIVMAGTLLAAPPAASSKKEAAKPTGRLPAYFSKVVTPEQRIEIYTIQTAYREEIAKTKKEMIEALEKLEEEYEEKLSGLEEQEDEEVDAVLSKEQLAEVNSLREAARKSTASRKSKTSKK